MAADGHPLVRIQESRRCHLRRVNPVTFRATLLSLKPTELKTYPKKPTRMVFRKKKREEALNYTLAEADWPTPLVRVMRPKCGQRRWNDALHAQFGSLPVTHGEILQAIDPEMQAAATAAERRCRGAGLKYTLNRLLMTRSNSSANSEP